jgi:hypothetical protein
MIGLNEVDPRHYRDGDGNPWKGELAACENDARDLASLAKNMGFAIRGPLLTEAATSTEALSQARAVAQELVAGDIFLSRRTVEIRR